MRVSCKLVLTLSNLKNNKTHDTLDSKKDWITINGIPVPIDENGNLKGSIGNKINKQSNKGNTKVDNLNSTGANPNLPPFTEKSLDRHFGSGEKSDHSVQYPEYTKEQYAQRALELAQSEVGGDIDGYKATKGSNANSIVRYDKITNDWVRAYPSTGVATLFKPNNGHEYFQKIKGYET